MSVRASWDTWCDGPGPDGQGCLLWAYGATSTDSRVDARRQARRSGWIYKRGVGDLCPHCQKILA